MYQVCFVFFTFNDYINVHLDNSVLISASHLCVQVHSQDLLDL